jgi:hypothetical protein
MTVTRYHFIGTNSDLGHLRLDTFQTLKVTVFVRLGQAADMKISFK